MELTSEQQGDHRHFSWAILHTAGCQFKTNHIHVKNKFFPYALLLVDNSLHESICILIIYNLSFKFLLVLCYFMGNSNKEMMRRFKK